MNNFVTDRQLLELVENPHVQRNLKRVLLKKLRQRVLRIRNDKKRNKLLNRYLRAYHKVHGIKMAPSNYAANRHVDTEDEEEGHVEGQRPVLNKSRSTSRRDVRKSRRRDYQLTMKISEFEDYNGENITEVTVLEYRKPQSKPNASENAAQPHNHTPTEATTHPGEMLSEKTNGLEPGSLSSGVSSGSAALDSSASLSPNRLAK